MRSLLFSSIAALSLSAGAAQAADEGAFLEKIQPSLEQTFGHGQTALWTMPDIATQYQPLQPTPAIQAALKAQREGRILEALITLEDAIKAGGASEEARDEMILLRSSLLLQGGQSQQVLEIHALLTGNPRHAADAHALTAMARLHQGQMREALEVAQHARDENMRNKGNSSLPSLALSYALQGTGQLVEARAAIHEFNSREPQQATALAREAELALMADQVQTARALIARAQESWAANPYVVAVGGLVDLMDGHAGEARAAFESALLYDPKDTKALLGLGLAEIRLGNFAAGQKQLQAANEAAPGNALILTYLGRAQQQAGQTEAATASWRSAQQADPKDPTPWLYQAQAALQANRPLEARESLREAQSRAAYRSVYRGEGLLREDQQLLQANLAAIQQKLGMDNLAFHTLADPVGEKNANTLRNQADLLQGRRFGESARRSLLLQSLFNDRPGNLPATLDVYGDGAGQTGASTPQHGAVSGLSAQHASYNNYDELFGGRTLLEVDSTAGSKNSNGEHIRLGVGNDTLGVGLAGLQFKTDGFARFENLDNRAGQAIVQWRPSGSTQAFVSQQTFKSQRGEVFFPADLLFGNNTLIADDSKVSRLGLRHSLTDNSELRALWSFQQTAQTVDYYDLAVPPNSLFSVVGSSGAHSAELQYRRSGAAYTTQWGVQQTRGQLDFWYPAYSFGYDYTQKAQQFYAAWQQALNPQWQLDAGLSWGKVDKQDNLKTFGDASTKLARWLPKLGAVYAPDAATHVRLAAWRGMGVFSTGDATLTPVSLAGFLLNRPDDNGKLVQAAALGGDRQLSTAWQLAAEAQRRRASAPAVDNTIGQQDLYWQQVDESRLVLHWQPQGMPWSVSLAYDDERVRNDPRVSALDSVDEQRMRGQQLKFRWFVGAQWTVNMAWGHNRVAGMQKLYDPALFTPMLAAYQDGFNQVDADLDWQFARSGSLTAGVRNASDTRFQYADIDRLNPRFSNRRLVFAKIKLAF